MPMLFRDGEKNPDDFGIKLGAGATANFLFGVGHRQRPSVRAIADHSVEGVGNGEYAGAKRNLLSAETAGIAGAVEEFLVGQNNLRRITKKRNAAQHVVADVAVRAHDLFFVIVQRARLAENGIGNGHLADVVEECSASHDREVARGNWNCLGDGNGEGRDALAMAVGFHIFKFKSAAESFDGVVISLCEGCGQFLGSFSKLVHDCTLQALENTGCVPFWPVSRQRWGSIVRQKYGGPMEVRVLFHRTNFPSENFPLKCARHSSPSGFKYQ